MILSLRNPRKGLMRQWFAGFQASEQASPPSRRRVAAQRLPRQLPALWADCPGMLGSTAAERDYDFASTDAGAFDIHEAWGVHEQP
jgi:hypothetical protein